MSSLLLFFVDDDKTFSRRFSMVEHSNGEESVSRFLIAPILDQDGGEVVCEVSNRYGRDAKTFLLSIEGRNSIFLSEKSVHYHEIYLVENWASNSGTHFCYFC